MDRTIGGLLKFGTKLLIAVVACAMISFGRADESVVLKPVRLQADGQDIDTGENWGHSGPCVADVDGDGCATW